jgi:hypothetical protein
VGEWTISTTLIRSSPGQDFLRNTAELSVSNDRSRIRSIRVSSTSAGDASLRVFLRLRNTGEIRDLARSKAAIRVGEQRFEARTLDQILLAAVPTRDFPSIEAQLSVGGSIFAELEAPDGQMLRYEQRVSNYAEVVQWIRRAPDRFAGLNPASCPEDPLCFITSACSAALGLPDHAWELRCLRRFRDERLISMEGGASDIAHYYTVAPRVLDAIWQTYDPMRELNYLYRVYVFPSAVLAAVGADSAAHKHYRRMMRRLCCRFSIATGA